MRTPLGDGPASAGEETVSYAAGGVTSAPAPAPDRAAREASSADRADDLTGVQLDNLIIEKRIGAGGMGEVWKARDSELDIPVAVKVLPQRLATDPQFLIRFLREARAVARLDHPNIVRVFQAGRREHRGGYLRVMVMEFVDGIDARHATRTAPESKLPPRRAAEIVLGVARGLRYAHGKGVVHRDIKPANLLIPRAAEGPAVKVLDFGIAQLDVGRAAGAKQGDDDEGAIMGTPYYLSPEQAQGKPVDSRADIYALGITLYELLTGRVPYKSDRVITILQSHIDAPLPFPPEAFSSVPPMFCELIAGMCAKAPDHRLPLGAVIERLDAFLGIAEAASDESVAPPPQAPTNLARLDTSFVGRRREMDELGARIDAGARLITVMGPGGIGKTRFVHEFGLAVASRYPAGVWFCDLTEARTPEGICQGVGQGMGVGLTQDEPVAQIHAALRMRGRMLVILDNFEQVTEHAAATLGVWLKGVPEVRFIATSREPLHLAGEQTFPLVALEVTDDGESPAVQLFVDRACAARKDFKLGDDNSDNGNAAAVRRIVTELDGIPLAIELAAARVSALTPQMILERLPKRFDLLTSRRRDASAKQMTLRGAIDWSWNLLSGHEKLALAQCSVFRDGFLLDAAEAVLDLSAFPDAPMVIDVVESLVEKSLVRVYEVPQLHGEARYRMYESIRDYAERKIVDPDALPGHTGTEATLALRARHAAHYVRYAQMWDGRIPCHEGAQAMNRIGLELENLYAVQDEMEISDPGLAARALLAAAATLRLRGPWQPRIPRALRALAAIADRDPPVRIALLTLLAHAHFDCGTIDGLRQTSAEAEALARAPGAGGARPAPTSERLAAEPLIARALQSRALAYERTGEYEAALACHAEAASIHDKLQDRAGAALSAAHSGTLHFRRGDFAAALACHAKAEAIDRELGHRAGIARDVGNRGMVHRNRGEYAAALACYAEAQAIDRELGDRASLARILGNQGLVHENQGDYAAALACFAESEKIHRELGNRAGIARQVGNRGMVHKARGEYDVALACYAEAESLHGEVGNLAGVARTITNRGNALLERGDLATALEAYRTAEALHRSVGDRVGLAGNLANRGSCLKQMGSPSDALAPLEESCRLRVAMEQKDADTFRTLAMLAAVHRDLAVADAAHAPAALATAARANACAVECGIAADHHDPDVRRAIGWVAEILAGGEG